jgi:hypothetical protein
MIKKILLERGNKWNSSLLFLVGTVCWTLWLNRNNCIFRDKLISSLKTIIFKLIFFMQWWKISAREKNKGHWSS